MNRHHTAIHQLILPTTMSVIMQVMTLGTKSWIGQRQLLVDNLQLLLESLHG